jgi:hypothetical protein
MKNLGNYDLRLMIYDFYLFFRVNRRKSVSNKTLFEKTKPICELTNRRKVFNERMLW